MHIFLTGGTGFIGRALVLRLAGEGHQVTVWTRSAERARHLMGMAVELLQVEADDRALREALEQADAVINLSGESIIDGRWTDARKRALKASRVDVTERLIRVLSACKQRPQVLVSASAVGYYGDRGDRLLSEDETPGDGMAADLCQEWEAAAMRAEDLGVRVALMRIGVVLGHGGGALESMLPVFKLGLGGRLGSGRQYMPWVHIDDVLDIFSQAITDERMAGPYNVVAPRPVDNRTFTRTLAEVLDRPALIPVPALGLRVALGEAASMVLASVRAVPVRLQELGYSFHFSDLRDALEDLLADHCHIEDVSETPDSYRLDTSPRFMLYQETEIDAPIEDVFEFFSRAENLGAITPPGLSFHLHTPSPIQMHAGTVIDYQIRLGPIPMRWQTLIEQWKPGESFVDTQARGPYSAWWHEHRFTSEGERTRMEDRVYYTPPMGLLGRIANRVFVGSMLQNIFNYREHAIRHRFASRQARERHSSITRASDTKHDSRGKTHGLRAV